MIGLFGGTFDPVHYAHLRCVLEVQQQCELEQIRFIPCRMPPHRISPLASPAQRLAMLQLAVDGQPGFEIDERELRRNGPSYMIDTLISLREDLGMRPMCLVLGFDSFAQLDSWHRWQSLIEHAHIIVMDRPGYEATLSPDINALLEKRLTGNVRQLRRESAGRIIRCPVTGLDISATRIREAVASGRTPRYLLPEPVLDYIRRERLYLDAESSAAEARG